MNTPVEDSHHTSTDGTLSRPAGRVLNLWLVEDDEAIRCALEELLDAPADLQCSRSFGCAEDLLVALASAPAPDVILCDLNLPGRSGIEAIKPIKALAPATAVVIMTLFSDSLSAQRARAEGAAGFVLKSYEFEAIREQLYRAWRETQAAARPAVQPAVAAVAVPEPSACAAEPLPAWRGLVVKWVRSRRCLRSHRTAARR